MMNKNTIYNKNQSGRSMIEMLGVLSIVAFLTIGGIAGYIKASHQLKVNKFMDDISHLVANVRTLFYTQSSYKSLDNITLIKTGLAPGNMISKDGTSLITRSKGSVYLKSAKSPNNDNGAFIIIFNGLSESICASLLYETWGSDMQTGFLGITVKNDGDLTIETSNLLESTFSTSENTFNAVDASAITVAKAHELCSCGSSDICSIAWKFI